MASSPLGTMIGRVRRVVAATDSAALPDNQLLESFLEHGDEAAFAVLLRRHGPMVLGVCRRLLPESHDAEDAFQATFLVLVRKAHAIGRRELLANWLYGVASRTARKARALLARYAPLLVNVRAQGVDRPNLVDLQEMYKERAPKVQRTLLEALDLAAEKRATRAAYGETPFGQGCLVARRLVERGVPVVEVTLGGWDAHADNFTVVERQSRTLDAGWGMLLAELKERKLLDTTLIVWAGEFGRAPQINAQQGRDHWSQAFTVVLAGGGIKGGQVIGKTDADGQIQARPVSVPEYLATVCTVLGVDYTKRNSTAQGVLVPIVDGNPQPLAEVVAGKAEKK